VTASRTPYGNEWTPRSAGKSSHLLETITRFWVTLVIILVILYV